MENSIEIFCLNNACVIGWILTGLRPSHQMLNYQLKLGHLQLLNGLDLKTELSFKILLCKQISYFLNHCLQHVLCTIALSLIGLLFLACMDVLVPAFYLKI